MSYIPGAPSEAAPEVVEFSISFEGRRSTVKREASVLAMVRGFPYRSFASTCSVFRPAGNWIGMAVIGSQSMKDVAAE